MPDAQLLCLWNCTVIAESIPNAFFLQEELIVPDIPGSFKQLVNIEYPLMFLCFCLNFLTNHPFLCLFVSRGGWHAASVNEAEVDGSGDGESELSFNNQELVGIRLSVQNVY